MHSGQTRVLDHLVYATPELAATVEEFAERTGVRPAPGGVHPGLGTRNHLVDLGEGRYLEIIGPDPEAPEPRRPRPFGIDELTGPRLVTWALCPVDLDATVGGARSAGYDPGPVVPMSRTTAEGATLNWRLAGLTGQEPPGLVPFLIDWGTSPHPTSAPGLPRLTLEGLQLHAMAPGLTLGRLSALGALTVPEESAAGATTGVAATGVATTGPVLVEVFAVAGEEGPRENRLECTLTTPRGILTFG
ncbi:VOC family protein [Streptomyces sp. NA04227]|uniref:VOC family protein n=1 Tax=Streptomyces sp. NA04227 TaxID=2742136 RepID=UPI0020CA8E27|nr:VOC family protein [Streptomyces sp. NA04227]